jgi:hypothetical protein
MALNAKQDEFTQKTIYPIYENKSWIYVKKKTTNEVTEPHFGEGI